MILLQQLSVLAHHVKQVEKIYITIEFNRFLTTNIPVRRLSWLAEIISLDFNY